MSDDLLIVLSQRGEVAWPTFRHYVKELTARPDRAEPAEAIAYHESVTLKALEALGHVSADFFGGTETIRIAPRVLAQLPVAGRPQAILVGHRLATTEQELREACAAQPGTALQAEDDDVYLPLVPRRLLVEADDPDLIATVARAVEARYTSEPAAWRVLQYAGTIAEYEAGLSWMPQRPPNWERRDFDPNVVAFREPGPGTGPRTGLGEYRDPHTSRSRYYLCRGIPTIETVEVDRDWGRYVVLAAAKRSVLLYTHAGEVAVPLSALVPAPYAAGLALCLGYAPREARFDRPAGHKGPVRYLVHRGVPRALAELAATKLGQWLEPVPALAENA
jgi:hypothetical protein